MKPKQDDVPSWPFSPSCCVRYFRALDPVEATKYNFGPDMGRNEAKTGGRDVSDKEQQYTVLFRVIQLDDGRLKVDAREEVTQQPPDLIAEMAEEAARQLSDVAANLRQQPRH